MARSSYAQFVSWVKANLISQSTFVTDPENVLLDESLDLFGRNGTEFPRIEFQIVGAPRRDFVNQRVMDKSCQISVQGYLRRETDQITDEDTFDLIDFHAEVESIIFSIHNQIVAGAPDVPEDFVKLSGMTEAFIVNEIEPKTAGFIFNFNGEFSARDTKK